MSASNRSRETAVRLFAHELRESDKMFKEDDDDYAPSYLLLPSGGKANRVLVMGTLIEKENKNDDYYSVRITDTTGNFLVYAGKYQPEATATLRDLEVPSYVAVIAKPDTFETDDGNIISTLRPERIIDIDEDTRDKWLMETAEQTLERLSVSPEDDEYVAQAEERYGEERMDLVEVVIETLEEFKGETEDDANE